MAPWCTHSQQLQLAIEMQNWGEVNWDARSHYSIGLNWRHLFLAAAEPIIIIIYRRVLNVWFYVFMLWWSALNVYWCSHSYYIESQWPRTTTWSLFNTYMHNLFSRLHVNPPTTTNYLASAYAQYHSVVNRHGNFQHSYPRVFSCVKYFMIMVIYKDCGMEKGLPCWEKDWGVCPIRITFGHFVNKAVFGQQGKNLCSRRDLVSRQVQISPYIFHFFLQHIRAVRLLTQ